MLKKRMFAVCLVLLAALGACGGPKRSAGLLTDEEIGKMESLYLVGSGTALEGLGFSENDLDKDSDNSAGSYPLKQTRSIAGVDFRQIVLTSVVQPEGLYGMRFHASFVDKQEAQKAWDALCDVITELYGEPVYPETERWKAGELTELSLHFFGSDDYSEDGAYRYILELDYSIPSVVDGKRLTRDEMLEMVKSVQQKQ